MRQSPDCPYGREKYSTTSTEGAATTVPSAALVPAKKLSGWGYESSLLPAAARPADREK